MSGQRVGRWSALGVAAVIVAAVVVTAGFPSGVAAEQAASFQLVNLRRPDGERVALADPDVIRVDDTWYLYGTSSSDGFEVWSSTDLATWTYGGLAWSKQPGAWYGDTTLLWAPEVFAAADGSFWLYYTASQRIGVAKASGPLGPFVDQLDHPLVGNGYGGVGDGELSGGSALLDDLDDKAIDAEFFVASDGSSYLYFSQTTPFSEVAVLPMADAVTPAAASPTVVLGWEGNLETWEWWVREGPVVIERDGTFHLMYSGFDFASTCYSVGVATSDDPMGPFVRRPDNPILSDDPAVGFYGPGHHSVVDDGQGALRAYFHVQDDEAYDGTRSTGWSPLVFGADGRIDILAPGDTQGVDPACLSQPGPIPTTTSTTTAPPPSTVPDGLAPPARALPGRPAYAG